MKKIIMGLLIASAACIVSAQQSSTKIQANDVGIYNAEVELLGTFIVAPKKCPTGAVCTLDVKPVKTYAKIKVNLNGCVDRLVKLSHNTILGATGLITTSQGAEQEYTLNIAAISASNKMSLVADCFVMPSVIKDIFVGEGYISKENIKLNVLR